MNTLLELRYDLLGTINNYSDDSNIDYRELDQWINTYRVKWLENTYNKFNKQIPEAYFQTLTCIDLELVSTIDCCSVSDDCKILRSVQKLPTFLSLIDGELIAKVSSPPIVNSTPDSLYHIMRYEQAEFFGNGRYNKHKIGAFLYNGYIYLITKEDNFYLPQLTKINVRGVFQNPHDAGRFVSCEGKLCFSPADEYPLEPRLWTYIKQDILTNELKLKLSIPEDSSNNASAGGPLPDSNE